VGTLFGRAGKVVSGMIDDELALRVKAKSSFAMGDEVNAFA
jgi:hypothetical protein